MTYKATFTRSGLPSGTDWWVNRTTGQSFESDKPAVSFSEPNGTYSLSTASAKKSSTGPSGEIIVYGDKVSETVKFTSAAGSIPAEAPAFLYAARWSVRRAA